MSTVFFLHKWVFFLFIILLLVITYTSFYSKHIPDELNSMNLEKKIKQKNSNDK